MKHGPAIAITVTIFLLSWFGRGIQRFFREAVGLEGLLLFVSVVCLIFLVSVARFFELRRGKIRLLLLLFPLGIWFLRGNPEEAVHLVEYGALALALLWGANETSGRWRAAIKAGFMASLIGLGDEVLQGINPERFFDLRDIVINVSGAILTLILFRLRRTDAENI